MRPIWQEAKELLKRRIPDGSFHLWVDPIQYVSSDQNALVLACPNRFSLSWVRDNYLQLISSELQKLSEEHLVVRLVVTPEGGNESATKPPTDTQLPLPCIPPEVPYGVRLCPRFTFEQFVTGSSNSFAFSMARAVAQGTNTYNNFLYFLSDTGLGKSHLSQAIAHDFLQQNKSKQLIYLTAEDFTNDMVRALRTNTIEQFKEKYRSHCDVLLLDEVHFLEGKERTQTELGLLLDRLFEANRTVIVTSSRLPKDIPRINSALRSRLTGGLIASILPPDHDTRVKIIQKKAHNQGISLPDEVTDYLAGSITNDIRQLESAVIGLAAQSSLLHQPITLDLAKEVTQYLVTHRKEVSLALIQSVVSQHYKVTLDDIRSKSRRQIVAHPRHVAIYLSRTLTKESLESIGKAFNRNHATVLHAVNSVRREMSKKSHIAHQVEYLAQQINSGE